MSHFVLELGTEELPSRFLSSLERELSSRFEALFSTAGLSYEQITSNCTPRRAVLHVRGLGSFAEQQIVLDRHTSFHASRKGIRTPPATRAPPHAKPGRTGKSKNPGPRASTCPGYFCFYRYAGL